MAWPNQHLQPLALFFGQRFKRLSPINVPEAWPVAAAGDLGHEQLEVMWVQFPSLQVHGSARCVDQVRVSVHLDTCRSTMPLGQADHSCQPVTFDQEPWLVTRSIWSGRQLRMQIVTNMAFEWHISQSPRVPRVERELKHRSSRDTQTSAGHGIGLLDALVDPQFHGRVCDLVPVPRVHVEPVGLALRAWKRSGCARRSPDHMPGG
jgi:hypothetical protein